MDPAYRIPPAPGTPFFPVSPERANQQKHHPHNHHPLHDNLPSSSSMSSHAVSSSRAPSDVQGKVAQFNSLTKDAAARRREQDAALQRAVEAENAARRAKEENKRITGELEHSRSREGRLGERLDRMMEELHRTKETHAQSQTVYEKEIRRARKEAFKASSVLVRLQEELKGTRESLRSLQFETVQQRAKTDERERDAFAARYQLVGAQEELSQMKESVRLLQEERDALRTSLKEEEVARVAAEGGIALPVSNENDEFASPRKKRSPASEEVVSEVQMTTEQDEMMLNLVDDLRLTKRRMHKAEDQVEHMKMECQLRCCSCRLAERKGASYGQDTGIQDAVSKKLGEMEEALVDEVTETMKLLSLPRVKEEELNERVASTELQPVVEETTRQEQQQEAHQPEVAFCRNTGTFQLISPTKGDSGVVPATSPHNIEPQETDYVMVNGHESPPPVEASEPPPTAALSPKEEESPPISTAAPMTPVAAQPFEDLPIALSIQDVPPAPPLSPLNDTPSRQEVTASPNPTTDGSSPTQSPIPPTPPPHHHHHYHHHTQRPFLRTITTTTTIPLAGGADSPTKSPIARPTTTIPITHLAQPSFVDPSNNDARSTTTGEVHQQPQQEIENNHPFQMTMTREEALEQIRLRRGRARSIAANTFTPRKQMVEGGVGIKRDVSAPALRG
ncbi:MAG: hypothetical protein M1823_000697 [Watsoniomyces obsoletus]|nr:MAG: hypothetical protein M1823_000697 [Watsoniomyces obsoletus]